MAGTTSTHELPYPHDTDAPLGGSAIQALAERLEQVMRWTPWADLSVVGGGSGFTGGTGGLAPQVRRKLGVVHLRGAVTPNSAVNAAGKLIATVPAGFRPGGTVRFLGMSTTSPPTLVELELLSSGALSFYQDTYHNTSPFAFSIVYSVDD